jgi:hypothetical protein
MGPGKGPAVRLCARCVEELRLTTNNEKRGSSKNTWRLLTESWNVRKNRSSSVNPVFLFHDVKKQQE